MKTLMALVFSMTTTPETEITFSNFRTDNGSFGTVTVKGINDRNYNENRVFRAKGARWVLGSNFGVDCMEGAKFFFARQYDLPEDFAETRTHIAKEARR